jgi:3-isopropylmalate/(R)-2-methylmalate dehydratase large subunit
LAISERSAVDRSSRTLYQKLVDSHVVRHVDAEHVLLYADLHVLNEYTSPQAFAGLRTCGRLAWRPDANLAVIDHVNSTRTPAAADTAAIQLMDTICRNCRDFEIELFDLNDRRQGIEHIVVPEQGLAVPGMVIVCGDSHTTTYGAFGALGFGVGTSEVEHLLATQTLAYRRLKNFLINVTGILPNGVTAKDLIMAVIGSIGAAGANGFAVEFAGEAIAALDMPGRMTICNMAMECGARAAVIAPDAKTLAYVSGRPRSTPECWLMPAHEYWSGLHSDADALFERRLDLDAAEIEPLVTWGTSPEQVVSIGGRVPDPALEPDSIRRASLDRSIRYMGLAPNLPISGLRVDRVFIGSCTNGRLEDLRAAAAILQGRRVSKHVRAMVVPGSREVRRAAEQEGLSDIFIAAGFEWRDAGCSMCLAMNDDVLAPGERCASTTNRNFEGRQGRGGRTHLMSPAMAAAAAVCGQIVDVRRIGT